MMALEFIELWHQQALGWRVVNRFLLIWSRFDLLLWFVCGLVLQLWLWYGLSLYKSFSDEFYVGQHTVFSVSLLRFCWVLLKTFWAHVRILSAWYKIVSKPYQNHIKTIETLRNRPKACPVLFISVSFLQANPPEPPNKLKPHQIHIISISSQNRIKPHQNHRNLGEIYQNTFF